MNNQQFWEIIQISHDAARGDDNRQHALLVEKLIGDVAN